MNGATPGTVHLHDRLRKVRQRLANMMIERRSAQHGSATAGRTPPVAVLVRQEHRRVTVQGAGDGGRACVPVNRVRFGTDEGPYR
jgi:hypothetical protein